MNFIMPILTAEAEQDEAEEEEEEEEEGEEKEGEAILVCARRKGILLKMT